MLPLRRIVRSSFESPSCSVCLPPSRWPLLLRRPFLRRPPPDVATQLPRSVVPSHYDVTLTPDAANMTFAGQVKIDLEVKAPTDAITLQAADLTFRRPACRVVRADEDHHRSPRRRPRPSRSASRWRRANTRSPSIMTARSTPRPTGLFALDYDRRQGQAARALHPVREQRPAPHDPVVGRAVVQGDLHAERHRPQGPDGGQQHAGRQPHAMPATASTRSASPSRPKMSTYLLFFGLGDFDRITTKAGRHRDRRHHASRQIGAGAVSRSTARSPF